MSDRDDHPTAGGRGPLVSGNPTSLAVAKRRARLEPTRIRHGSRLESVVYDERGLSRVELCVSFKPFNGGNALGVLHGSQGHGIQHAAAVDVDRTGPALAAIASFFRPGQSHAVTQRVEQCRSRFEAQLPSRGH
jgi:hypothetical protein